MSCSRLLINSETPSQAVIATTVTCSRMVLSSVS
jgi:hypothetical protein